MSQMKLNVVNVVKVVNTANGKGYVAAVNLQKGAQAAFWHTKCSAWRCESLLEKDTTSR